MTYTYSSFFAQLLGLSLVVAIIIVLLHQLALFQPYILLSWISLILFICWNMLLFFIGKRSLSNKDRNAFSRLILAATTGKMFLAVAVVAVYHEVIQPESKFFLMPFFVVYLFYTIFEVYFMSRLGRVKA